VHKADVPALVADSPIRGEGADRFQYHLAITGEGGRQELTVSEDRVRGDLRELIERVRNA
jgi:hypothetical protein